MRTRSQTSNIRRRKATSPPLSPISELSQDNGSVQQDDDTPHMGIKGSGNEETDAPTQSAGPPESHTPQMYRSKDAQNQEIIEPGGASAILPQPSLTPPPPRQTIFLPSPEHGRPRTSQADPRAEAEVNMRFEEEKRLGEAHFAALGLVASGSQSVEVDSVAGGDDEGSAITRPESSNQYHTRQQARQLTQLETEAAEILLNLRRGSVAPIPRPCKTRGPNKKKSTAQLINAKARKVNGPKPKSSPRKQIVSKLIVSASSSDDQADPKVATLGTKPSVRFAEQDDIRHFDTEGPTHSASSSSCIDTPSFSRSGPEAKDMMIIRPQSPIKAHMDRDPGHTPADAGPVPHESMALSRPISGTSFDFPVDLPNTSSQVLARTQESPRERIGKLGNYLIESVTERPAYITDLYRVLIAKGDLATARKLLELVHFVQRRNVADMPPLPRPLTFTPPLETDRRIDTAPPVLTPRQTLGMTALMSPTASLTGGTGTSDGGHERPAEDLRYLRREVSPDTP